jgi:hypothetical protein
MSESNFEDFLLDNLVALAAHHGEKLERKGSQVQTPDGRISLNFNNIQFGERIPGNFVILATVQISDLSTGMANLYDSLLEGGPEPDIPVQHALMEAYHLLQFVRKALHGMTEPDTTLALTNAAETRGFNVYSYGPIVRADADTTREMLQKNLEGSWVFKKVFAEVPSALTMYKPYWVKVNHLKAGDANIPECRLDETDWLEVKSQIATFQWPVSEEMMGYKQFFIFVPSYQKKNGVS